MPRPDDLYTRYMKAFQDHTVHTADCADCRPDQPCAVGAPVFERFSRLQDAYLQRQRDQRPRRR